MVIDHFFGNRAPIQLYVDCLLHLVLVLCWRWTLLALFTQHWDATIATIDPLRRRNPIG